MRIRAIAGWALMATLCTFAGACNRNALDPNLPAITTQPVDTTAKVGSTATFTVVATGQAPLSYQWFVFAKKINGATSASYTTGTLAASDNNSFYFCLVTNSIGSIESNEALLTVTTTSPNPGTSANTLGNANPSDVLTQHNDPGRTGQYLGETLLTPANVNSAKFGRLGTLITDGQVDAQPLYASGVTLPSGDVRNILYAATEHGSVYAFDATSGSVIWQTGLAGANEQATASGSCSDKLREGGVTATPVIDRTHGPHGAIYVIANTKDAAGTVIQRIHALDIATGAELFGGPTLIQASASVANAPTSSSRQNFDAGAYETLSGLQLLNGKIFAAWGPSCSTGIDSGWLIAFDAANLNSAGSVYLAPVGSASAFGFAPTGLAADPDGELYMTGRYRGSNPGNVASSVNTTNVFLKVSVADRLQLRNYSTTGTSAITPGENPETSGAAIVLPDLSDASGYIWHLAVAPGNKEDIYLLNRDSVESAGVQSAPVLEGVGAAFTSPQRLTTSLAFYSETVYFAAPGDSIGAFAFSDARLVGSPINRGASVLGTSGAQIAVSANGKTSGILWAVESDGAGILHAYDATDLSHELYNSTQAANLGRAFDSTVSATSPTIAGGRVYVATKDGIVVFGQLK